jgi:hypothetical protein
MNTRNRQDKKSRRQTTRQREEPKKRGQNHHMLHGKRHEQELPETRLTR